MQAAASQRRLRGSQVSETSLCLMRTHARSLLLLHLLRPLLLLLVCSRQGRPCKYSANSMLHHVAFAHILISPMFGASMSCCINHALLQQAKKETCL
jgi:hypothetical protein